jgi:hypothetical protein
MPETDPHGAPVVVATFPTTGEAEVVQAKLQSYGVDSEVYDETEGGTIPVDGEFGAHVSVRAVDAGEARRVLGLTS